MAIQILGLREFFDNRYKKMRKAERFFENNWRAESVAYLFDNLDTVLKDIPKKSRWNLYYTAAHCKEEKGRIFESQDIIPFDIDDIDVGRIDAYITIFCEELELNREHIVSVFSGNGLQFIIQINEPITDVKFFDRERHAYKAICGRINQALYKHGLNGNADASVFSSGRLLRLPSTINKKKNRPEREAYVIYGSLRPCDFVLSKKTGLPQVIEGEHVHPKAFTKLPAPDSYGVQEGCDFLKYCNDNQQEISEPQWYAMLSILARLEGGMSLCHDYSKHHPDYNELDCEFKANQAVEASGPRTCDNISTLWDGCHRCPYYQKVKSPILIKSDRYCTTKETGFYDMTIDKNGVEKRGKPNYDDLVKYFQSKNPYCTMEEANIVHTFDGRKWTDISRNRVHAFAEDNFDPKPTNAMCAEFEAKLKRTQLKPQDWFQVDGKINFDNGTLDLATLEMEKHSEKNGFKYNLPFSYDMSADCPKFKKFLDEVTLGRQELIDVLVEFMGYSICGVDPLLGQKALILLGDGSNGKSVFIEILRELAGSENYSTLSMGYEINKLENRYQLSGKLFNVSEETPTSAMVESSVFKALVSGGEVQARKLYCDSFSMRNFAKIIMACNELPRTSDLSHGMLRRLLIIPFDATFTSKNRDIHIIRKLRDELPGIFNLALQGYKRFVKNEKFSDGKIIDDSIKNYVEENDSVQNFMHDECKLDGDEFTSTKEIYLSYKFYCDTANIKALSMIHFGKRMGQILRAVFDIDCQVRRKVGTKNLRGFKGIRILDQGDRY